MKRIEMYKIDDYCKLFREEKENICLKENSKYVYVMIDFDENDEDEWGSELGDFVGVMYEDGSCSVVGCCVDRMCSYDEMIRMLFEDFM